MGIRHVVKDTERVFDCDMCRENISESDIAFCNADIKGNPQYTGGTVICRKCIKVFPEDVSDAFIVVSNGNETPKHRAAWNVYCAYTYHEDNECDIEEINLHEGTWAFFNGGEAETYSVCKIENNLNQMVDQHERCGYRDWPEFLSAILVDGKLRNFESIRDTQLVDW